MKPNIELIVLTFLRAAIKQGNHWFTETADDNQNNQKLLAMENSPPSFVCRSFISLPCFCFHLLPLTSLIFFQPSFFPVPAFFRI